MIINGDKVNKIHLIYLSRIFLIETMRERKKQGIKDDNTGMVS